MWLSMSLFPFEVLEQGFHKKALRVATLVGKRWPPETVIPKGQFQPAFQHNS